MEGRGRRPQGRGCFLLAVAGATSLVTLLLAVPITVLAVLALVPQEQGGLVSGCNRPRGLCLAAVPAERLLYLGSVPVWLSWVELPHVCGGVIPFSLPSL